MIKMRRKRRKKKIRLLNAQIKKEKIERAKKIKLEKKAYC